VAKFPLADQTAQILRNKSIKHPGVALLGIYTPPSQSPAVNATSEPIIDDNNETRSGTLVVFGDSSCFDDANERMSCNWLLGRILQVTNFAADPITELPGTKLLEEPFLDSAWNMLPPVRAEDVPFSKHSRVVGKNKPLTCPAQLTQSHPFKWEDKSKLTQVEWVEREIVPQTRTTPRPYATEEQIDGSYGYMPMYPFHCPLILLPSSPVVLFYTRKIFLGMCCSSVFNSAYGEGKVYTWKRQITGRI
jgi:hypothetical protein